MTKFKGDRSTCTKSPRKREPSNYAGGRHLRRAMKRLNARVEDFAAMSQRFPGMYTRPGSMKK